MAERFLRKEETRNKKNAKKDGASTTYVPKFFSPEGRPYNMNQAKVSFRLNDEEYRDRIVLEVDVYKLVAALERL